MRKFKINDFVVVKSNKKQDYGYLLHNTGTITALGMKFKGSFTYIVKFDLIREIRVFEEDLELAT